jgi:Family of unknown function (DUF5947)
MTSFATLRGLARKPDPGERCDLCGAMVAHQHQHLIDPSLRKLMCTCDACAILFSQGGETKYKRVPRQVRFLQNFSMTDAQWESLLIPIGLAFFVKSSTEGRVFAMYPGAAGSAESLLSLDTWTDIVEDNPVLALMQMDVEALLVNRLNCPAEYYLTPIDKCYELVGLIRSNWRGLAGGPEVWLKIKEYFTELQEASHA